jgi:poly(3-hydroxybutyrate) depolymerase
MRWKNTFLACGLSFFLLSGDLLRAADLHVNLSGTDYALIDYTYLGVPGRLYVPPSYDPNQPIPMVMFLHGLGESGTNNTSQINGNMYNLLKAARSQQFILFAPQSSGWWPELEKTVRTVGQIADRYNVDPGRIYLTGLSAGGFGTMNGIRQYSDLFAGFVPLSIAGGNQFTSPADAAPAVGRPIWFFAGGDPNAASEPTFAAASRQSVTNILTAENVTPLPTLATSGGYAYASPDGQLRYNQIAGGGHDNVTWNNGAYGNADLYPWLLSQSNPISAPQTGKTVHLSLANTSSTDPSGKVDSHGDFWNVANGYAVQTTTGVAKSFAKDQDQTRTTTTFEVTKPFYAVGSTASLPADAPYDLAVAGDYWRIYKYNINSGQLTIDGLVPGGEYDLSLFASVSTTDLNNYVGLYSVGSSSVIINAANNADLYTLSGLFADASGHLVLDVNLSGNSNYAILNALSVTAVPEPVSSVAGLLGLMGLLLRRREQASV